MFPNLQPNYNNPPNALALQLPTKQQQPDGCDPTPDHPKSHRKTSVFKPMAASGQQGAQYKNPQNDPKDRKLLTVRIARSRSIHDTTCQPEKCGCR